MFTLSHLMKQITQSSGRFYEENGIFYPSVTTILGKCFPKGDFLTKWIGDVGNEKAEAAKVEGGRDGTAVHEAIEAMIKGSALSSRAFNEKQKRCLTSFMQFWNDQKPKAIATEFQIKNSFPSLLNPGRVLRYAGSVDFKCRVKEDNYEKVWILDWKSSNSVQEYFHAQIASYIHGDKEATAGGIVHLGNGTRRGYSFIPIDVEKAWHKFVAVLELYYTLNDDPKPAVEKQYPDIFSLPIEGSSGVPSTMPALIAAQEKELIRLP